MLARQKAKPAAAVTRSIRPRFEYPARRPHNPSPTRLRLDSRGVSPSGRNPWKKHRETGDNDPAGPGGGAIDRRAREHGPPRTCNEDAGERAASVDGRADGVVAHSGPHPSTEGATATRRQLTLHLPSLRILAWPRLWAHVRGGAGARDGAAVAARPRLLRLPGHAYRARQCHTKPDSVSGFRSSCRR